MLYFKKFYLAIIYACDLVFIGLSGWFVGWSLADVNEWLQFVVLIITIIGLIWRMFKRKKV